VSPEAKRKGIQRSNTIQEALEIVPKLIIIPKASLYNKPESQLLRVASYQLREAILEYFIQHAPQSCRELKGYNEVSNVTLEVNGCDEFFVDLTRPVELMLASKERHKLDTRRRIIVECKTNQNLIQF